MGRRKADEDRVTLGDLTATPMRERGEVDGRRYWRIRSKTTRLTVKSGWWTFEEVSVVVAAEHANPSETTARRSSPEVVRTVGDLLRAWYRSQEQRHAAGGIARATLAADRVAVGHWRSTPVAEISIRHLTRAVVEDQALDWLGRGVMAASTVDLDVRCLRAAVAWGVKREHCRPVDFHRFPTFARDDEHVYCGRIPTRGEVEALILAIPAGARRDGIELLALTGARVGEVTALRVADANLVRRTLRLSGKDEEIGRKGKTRARMFPLWGRLLALVTRLAEDRPEDARLLDLPRSGSHLLHTELVRACGDDPAARVTPHAIRRMVVQELLETANPKRVSELTGHSVATLLRFYVRPTQADLLETVKRAGLGRPKPADGVVHQFPGHSARARGAQGVSGTGTAEDENGE